MHFAVGPLSSSSMEEQLRKMDGVMCQTANTEEDIFSNRIFQSNWCHTITTLQDAFSLETNRWIIALTENNEDEEQIEITKIITLTLGCHNKLHKIQITIQVFVSNI